MTEAAPSDPARPAEPMRLADLVRHLDVPDSERELALRTTLRADGQRPGTLGQFEDLAAWLASIQGVVPPRSPGRVRLVVFAGDHGIRANGVSANAAADSSAAVAALRSGASLVGRLADLADVGVRVVDVSVDGGSPTEGRIRNGSGSIDQEDAATAAEVAAAIALGAAVADEEIDAGADLLLAGDLGIGSTTVAATLISVLTASEPARVVGRGAGIDDAAWMRKVTAIRDARFRAVPRRADLDDLLAAVGGADIAALTGFLLRSAARRTPVLLDGVVTAAAAVLGREVDPRSARWWRAAVRTSEPAHTLALDRLRLDPIISHGIELGQGAGAVVSVSMLRAAARLASVADVGRDERGLDELGG